MFVTCHSYLESPRYRSWIFSSDLSRRQNQDQSMLSRVTICQCHMSAHFNCGLWWTRNIVFVILLIFYAVVHLIQNMVLVIAMSNMYPTGNRFHRLRFPSYLRESPLWLPRICNCKSLHNMTFVSFHIKLHVDHEWLAFIIDHSDEHDLLMKCSPH